MIMQAPFTSFGLYLILSANVASTSTSMLNNNTKSKLKSKKNPPSNVVSPNK